ncbi:restriction endonuclease subunit S [Nitrospira sp. MA-1]|nr:restriction endonuclease subunit S [Nitrospira sp. MA-1]
MKEDNNSQLSIINSPLIPPGYKQTEVGVIPEEWHTEAVANLVEPTAPICYGVVQVGQHTESGVPIVAIKFVKEIAHAPLHRTATSLEQPYARSRPRGGDVLISIKGTIGRVGIVPNGFKGNISRELARLRIGEDTSAEYIAHQLEAEATQERIMRSVVGTTRLEFSIATLRKFPLPLPPTKEEQKAIAEALSDADALIESLEQLLTKKRHLKQGAMQELLTGKKRLPGFEIKPGYKQTEVGVIPEDWNVTKLAATCSMKSGEGITSPSIDQFSEYPCFGGNGLRGFTTRFTHDGHYALIGRVGALCGNVLGVEGKFFASEHAIVVTASARTDTRWLTFVLGEMQLNHYSESSAQPVLTVSKLLKLEVAHPPTKAEQEAIAAILSDMDAEIAALETKLTKTRQLKQGMMQELLTGRIRLINEKRDDED